MSAKETQAYKASMYNELKAAGVDLPKKYASFSIAELEAGVARLHELQAERTKIAEAPVATAPEPQIHEGLQPEAPPFTHQTPRAGESGTPPMPTHRDELPGERLNRADYGEPLGPPDEAGRVWLQKEIRKPAYAKPRGRRVLRYRSKNTKVVLAKDSGDERFTESIELPDDGPERETEVKITLPSYQVGIYTRKGLPFRVFVYNSNEGFDFFEVNNYWGGVELVPPSVKRKYVENVLCYDIPSVVNQIRAEYRHLQLTGQIK